ncbi:helix-turn-helix domain-containing protein [Xylanimonas protaetiae]|uniref:XRE family transcriptional regulator n=1 Tax=Xylanimonas protaetiae TaxID=2509457 RepID=A0A4P6F2I8_9MICO|nr:helix-turn-helix transcriptional regulator [Xylanimonas protaetiae]QAY70050.1 XRE family transcriptional regulator [Xylanimonas protaetiae]
MKGIRDALRANLARIVDRSGHSQDWVAKAMQERGHKWHQTTVYKVLNGRRKVEVTEALDLADVLGVTLGALLGRQPQDTASEYRKGYTDGHNAATSELVAFLAKQIGEGA